MVGARDLEDPRHRLPHRAEAEAHEHRARELAAAFAGHEHVGARRAFGEGQHAVLLDDQRAPQRHHHQHAEQAAGEREHGDLQIVEVIGAVRGEENQCRQREHDAGGQRFACRADRLDDVVLEDRGAAEALEHRDGEHRDRNRGADGEPRPQAQIDRRGAEDQAEDGADHDGLDGELRGDCVAGT